MRVRTLLLAAALIAAFVYFTSARNWHLGNPFHEVGTSADRIWSGPDSGHSAGLGTDESNNISIYRGSHVAVVNITSTVYARGWFLEVIPGEGNWLRLLGGMIPAVF